MLDKTLRIALLWMCTFAAVAAGPAAVRKQVESSMLVTGTIEIATDGSVGGFKLDQQDALPPQVVQLAHHALPAWRFEPVVIDGRAAPISARMSMRFVATQLVDKKGYRLAINTAAFGREDMAQEGSKADGTTLQPAEMKPPMFPQRAYLSGITGTVYLILRIGLDGKVEDVASEQV